jgi:hypothetical protein
MSTQNRTQSSVFDALIHAKERIVDLGLELGTCPLIECRDWEKPVDSEAIAIFHECEAAILFSWSGITGTDLLCCVRTTTLESDHRSGSPDFKSAADYTRPQKILRRKY